MPSYKVSVLALPLEGVKKTTTREEGSEAIPSFFPRDDKILRKQDVCAVRIKIQNETK